MDPYAFERLICDLLIEMGYENVEVTQRSNDNGVDVKAVAQFGITTINEVIQARSSAGRGAASQAMKSPVTGPVILVPNGAAT